MNNFVIGDIDYTGFGWNPVLEPEESYQDAVSVSASNSGTNVPLTLAGGSNLSIMGQTATANVVLGVNGNIQPSDPAGALTVSSNEALDSFSLTYFNGPDDATNEGGTGVSNGHAIRISGFTFCVELEPDLSITKTSSANGSPVSPGEVITYTIVIENEASATGAANNVEVSDVLPNGVSYVPGSAHKIYNTSNILPGTFTHNFGSGSFDTGGLTQSYTVTSIDVPPGSLLTSYQLSTTGESFDWLLDISMYSTYPSGVAYLESQTGAFGGATPGPYVKDLGPQVLSGPAEGLYAFVWADLFDGVAGDDNSITTASFMIEYDHVIRMPTTNAAAAPINMVTSVRLQRYGPIACYS